MAILPHLAGGVYSKHPTAHTSDPIIVEIAPAPETSPDSDCDEINNVPAKRHGFSRKLANRKNSKGEKLGAKRATLLRYVAYRNRIPTERRDGKNWSRMNLDSISKQYPYIERATVDENLKRLAEFGVCVINSFNKRGYDRTLWYHVPDKFRKMAEDDIISFDAELAAKLGIPGAVIYGNWQHWIKENEKQGTAKQVTMSPRKLAELLPFSEPTIKRVLKDLCKQGYMEKVSTTKPVYGIFERGSKADENGSKADKIGSNPDRVRSKADNDMYCNVIDKGLEKDSNVEASALHTHLSNVLLFNHSSTPAMMDIPVSEQNQSSNFDTPVVDHGTNSNISGPAVNIAAGPDSLANFEEIRQFTRRYRDTFKDGTKQAEELLAIVWGICDLVLANFTPEDFIRISDFTDDDELLNSIIPKFDASIPQIDPNKDASFFPAIYYGALECVVGGFLWNQMDSHDDYQHGINILQRVTGDVRTKVYMTLDRHRRMLVAEEFAERRKLLASPDEDKEDDATLTPAEKMRYFRNGLSARNKVGWIFYDQQHRVDQIKVTKWALDLVQRYFETNPKESARGLLKIMDRCMAAYTEQPATEQFRKGVYWHARMGHKLHMFIKYLPTIERQLEQMETAGRL